jgi:hypothetical protein
VSYVIVDLDGTLVLENDEPNQPLIDALNEEVMSGDKQIIVVSARKIDRLQETRAWLQENKVAGVEEVHLNDFEGSAFAIQGVQVRSPEGAVRRRVGIRH